MQLEFWPADKSVADEPLRIPSGSASCSPLGAGRVSTASESESSAHVAWAEAWSSFFKRSKSCGSATVWVGLRLELGSTRVSWSTWSPMGGIREPGWAESLGGMWVGLRLGLIPTRATGSIRSPTGGIREPEWDKWPGDVWVGLRLGLSQPEQQDPSSCPWGVLESQGGTGCLGMCGWD